MTINISKSLRIRGWAGLSGVVLCTVATVGVTQTQNQPAGTIVIPPAGTIVTSAPTLNFYGLPGLVDMPSGEAMPDGQVAIAVSYFGGQTRTSSSFQFSPRLSGTFRYIGIKDWNSGGYNTYRDRSFDVRYLLLKEGENRPAVTVGLQDFSGTGIYAGEYVVATKNFQEPFSLPGKFKLTAGLGWGRLGSKGSIGTPFGGDRPTFENGTTGGKLSTDQWFRGPVAPFGGIEWQATDRIGLKAEYSSDTYEPETSRGVFDRKSQFNFGAEYQVRNSLRLGAYWLYGSEFGINAQLQLNPARPASPFVIAGPHFIAPRPDRSQDPERYETSWAESESAPVILRDRLMPELEEVGIRVESVSVSSIRAEARVSSYQIANQAIVVGRVARTMARYMPASVETFDIVLMNNGLAMSKVTIERIELETQEFVPNASGALLPLTVIDSAEPDAPANASFDPELYPKFSWSVGSFVRTGFFDPDRPIRADAGIAASAVYRFSPGWVIAGEARHRLVGNIGDSDRLSNSVLPHVRTDGVLYAREGDTTLENLYISHQWKPSKDTFARVSLGYFEQMYGGISSELLWKPAASRLGLGVEANYVKKRDFDQRFGFQDYDVVTGHVSAYYNVGKNYLAQVDAGRYLAKDYGATFTLQRQFGNGWRVGGFFTLTDVSSEDFGEGSFDKGISFYIPTSWFTGSPTKTGISETIRPIQRDGGARVYAPNRLYNQVRNGHQSALISDWGRVWE